MSFKVGDRVRPNTAVNWVNDTFMGTELLTVVEVKDRGTGNKPYFSCEDEQGHDTGLWIESELLLDSRRTFGNKRVTVSGESVRVVETHPDEVVIEVENSSTLRVEPFTPDCLVQVRVPGGYGPRQPWTYRDPSRKLEVGDRVLVPVGVNNDEHIGEVVGLGRGNCPSYVKIKDASALLVTQELTEAA